MGGEAAHPRRHGGPSQPSEEHDDPGVGQPRQAVFVALAGVADVAVGAGVGGEEGNPDDEATGAAPADVVARDPLCPLPAQVGVMQQQAGVG